jgi:hypothetical protein
VVGVGSEDGAARDVVGHEQSEVLLAQLALPLLQATAAAMITASAVCACACTASRIWAAVATGTRATPNGARRATGPLTSVTAAPRSRAATAMA